MKRKKFRRMKVSNSMTRKKWWGNNWMIKLFLARQIEAKTWFLYDAVRCGGPRIKL